MILKETPGGDESAGTKENQESFQNKSRLEGRLTHESWEWAMVVREECDHGKMKFGIWEYFFEGIWCRRNSEWDLFLY